MVAVDGTLFFAIGVRDDVHGGGRCGVRLYLPHHDASLCIGVVVDWNDRILIGDGV